MESKQSIEFTWPQCGLCRCDQTREGRQAFQHDAVKGATAGFLPKLRSLLLVLFLLVEND